MNTNTELITTFNNLNIECVICGNKYTSKQGLARHLHVHQPCNVCKHICLSLAEKKEHDKMHQDDFNSSPSTSRAARREQMPVDTRKRKLVPETNTTPPPPLKAKKVNPELELLCDDCSIKVPSNEWFIHCGNQKHKDEVIKTIGDSTQVLRSMFRTRILTYRFPKKDMNLNVEEYLKGLYSIIKKLINISLADHVLIKFNMELTAKYKLPAHPQKPEKEIYHVTEMIRLTRVDDIGDVIDLHINMIKTKMSEFQERDSGWTLFQIKHLDLNINKASPLPGDAYIQTPSILTKKRACINIMNDDVYCFKWCVIAAFYNGNNPNKNKTSTYGINNISQDIITLGCGKLLNFSGMKFPTDLKDIKLFEMNNGDISINVFGFDSKMKTIIGPYYNTKLEKKMHINLILLEDESESKFHYILISNISRLLSNQISHHNGRMLICNTCLYHTDLLERMQFHKEKECGGCIPKMPEGEKSVLKYTHVERQMDIPFAVYADFECILEDMPVGNDKNTQFIKKHIPCAYAFNIKCKFNSNLDRFSIFSDSNSNINVGEHFVNNIINECRDIYKKHFRNVVPMFLTPEEEESFKNARICHICGLDLGGEEKVRDHCHFSGKYRGAAHNSCNLNYKVPNFIPIFFHNFSSYDSHLFVKELLKIQGETKVIPLNKELYISLSHTIPVYSDNEIENLLNDLRRRKIQQKIPEAIINKQLENIRLEKSQMKVELRFLDSYRFMASSLDVLARNLSDDNLETVRKYFSSYEDFTLMRRKGVFPYEYVNNFEKLNENKLPPIEAFYSKLNDKACSEEDYLHATRVWKKFHCITIRDYMTLYLKTDVLLLTDIFENFRKVCKKIYNLDPAHYYTVPGLSWDAMLKYTKIELELLTDLEMYNFIKRGIRGGLTQCSKRYSKANHKYLKNYDDSKPSEYILYLDANNLYGWAMSEYLPYGGFTWTNDFVHPRDIAEDSEEGYIYEVDLSYPFSIHDNHNDLPFCVENKIIGGSKHQKLVADLSNKSKYVIHYKTLDQCLKNGLVLEKVHRILKFKQKPWLKTYIDLNTEYRTKAKNSFEKDFYKLLNNSVYGKTMENVDNRKDIRLVSEWNRTNRNRLGIGELISKPNFHSISHFTNTICAIQMNRTLTYYNKPIYLGFCVLELSKWKMYDFHYSYMKPKYGNRLNLNYMDTDSFIYSIQTDDFYNDIRDDIKERFDTSSYSKDNPFNFPLMNKKVLGMMKDETEGKCITEYVGLAPKVYSYNVENEEDVKKAKGVKKCIVNKYNLDIYKNVLFNKELVEACMYTFTSKLHTILTSETNKISLSFIDTKRRVCNNNVNTYAWHHYQLDTGDGKHELDMLLNELNC